MTRKGENIYQRKDGRWEGRYIKQRTPERKIIYGSVYGKKYTEVKQKLTLMKARQLTITPDFRRYAGTYEQWLGTWMTGTVQRTVKVTTYSNYYRLLKNYILPELGSYLLHQIEKTQIERFLDSLTERGLSPNSIRVIANLAKQSLEEAVKQRYLFINPFSLVSLPKQEIKTVQALSFKDQKELEHLALQEVSCSSVLLALYTGMRIGEISGLKWQDIDFEREMIQVKRTVTRIVDQQSPTVKTALITTVPKTSQSMRMIPMAQNLKQYLWQKYLETESEHVIVTTKGKRAEPRVINYRFKKMIAHTTFNQIHFHALRHTFATRALEQGVEIVSLSRILGHRSAKMTLDIYGDSLIEGRQKVIQAVDQLLEKTAHDSFKGEEQN